MPPARSGVIPERWRNEQNVLFDLKVVAADGGLMDAELQSTYGVGGSFRCSSVAAA